MCAGGGGGGGGVVELGPFPFQAAFNSDRAFVPGSLFTVHLTKLSEGGGAHWPSG